MNTGDALAALGRPVKWDRAVYREAAMLAKAELSGGRDPAKILEGFESEFDVLLRQWMAAADENVQSVGECATILFLAGEIIRFVYMTDLLLEVTPEDLFAAAEELISRTKSAAAATGDYPWAADVLALMVAETRRQKRRTDGDAPAT